MKNLARSLGLSLTLLLAGAALGGAGCTSSPGGGGDTGPGVGGDVAPDTGGGAPDGGARRDSAPDAPAPDAPAPDVPTSDPGAADPGAADAGPPPVDLNLAPYVDPFIGTDDSSSPHPVPGGAGGSTYPGAVAPFGMVQFSPDTPTASPSGYRYGDTEIEEFSLTHLDGAGCPNDEDLPILPVVGALASSPGMNWNDYRSTYSKTSEEASAGYYRVDLDRYGIRAELTATTRTGLARFTFPATTDARILVYPGRSATGTRKGSIEIIAPDRIRGTVTAGRFCFSPTAFEIHFAIVFDRPFADHGTWLLDALSPGSATATGAASGGYVTFDTSTDPTVQMRVGLSYVSVANAEANLQAESTGWDFHAARQAAEARWNEVLNRIQVAGGSDQDLTKFYTALYRVFQSPNVASDINGEYMGFDGKVHVADGVRYQNFSGWDIIRSWTHLVAAVAPETPDIIRSMVQDGVESGLLPFWTHQNVETHVMVGDPGTVNVANAYAMGVRGFDTAAALQLMRKSADDPGDTQRFGLATWLDQHYLGNAAISLEYAMADFALARFALALGDEAAHDRYLNRSDWWKESWNPVDGYIEARETGPTAGANAARIYEFQVFGPDAPGTDLALGGTATASGSCNADEGPDKAVNGTWSGGTSDKWCDNASSHKWWQVDLGAVATVSKIVIYHAGAGGEASSWNTADYTVAVSTDGDTWSTVATVQDNTDDITTHAINAVDARYLRLDIDRPIQGTEIGDWACQPFDPASGCGFVEGNAAQYLWMVPHDLEGLFTLMGGHEAAIARLDDLFTELNAGTDRPYFYIGNEPEHGTPWTYNFAGAPARTQDVVRRIVEEEFDTGPGGLPGNDDLGSTSAWLVWAYLGMYPVVPGTDLLVLHGPRFPSATLRLANGNTVTLRATGAGPGAPHIRALEVDGVPTTRSWLRFGDISGGATLDYTMGADADPDWGTGTADLPPSFGP